MWLTAIKELLGLGGTLLGGWAERKKIEALSKVKIAEAKANAEIDWDANSAANAEKSWKDEYILILWSIPMIMCFIPGLAEYAHAGFAELENTPVWYQAGFAVILASSYGIKKYATWRMKQLSKLEGEENG